MPLEIGNHNCHITSTRFAVSSTGKPCVIVAVRSEDGEDESKLWLSTDKVREQSIRTLRALGWDGEADLDTGGNTPLKGVPVKVIVSPSKDPKYPPDVRISVNTMLDAAPRTKQRIASLLKGGSSAGDGSAPF